MQAKKTTGSRLFLIEFLIVLFFFLFISTTCLRMFTYANSVTRRSKALFQAQNAAATIIENTKSLVYLRRFAPEDFTIFYDRDFHACPEEEAFYTLNASFTEDISSFSSVVVSVLVTAPDAETLFQLDTVLHCPAMCKEVSV